MTKIIQGNCVEVMAGLPAASFDAVVCDPPYGLEFMGKEWDKLDAGLPQEKVWKGRRGQGGDKTGRGDTGLGKRWENSPTVSYGARRTPFRRCTLCGKRQFSGTPCACPSPEWVDEWPEGPPSASVRMQRWHERWAKEALRVAKPGAYLLAFGGTRTFHRLACALEDAGWQLADTLCWLYGSGFPKHRSKLKPAWEPVLLAWKPARRATPLQIDACRVATADHLGGGGEKGVSLEGKHEGWRRPWMEDPEAVAAFASRVRENVRHAEKAGRWPANLVLSHVGPDADGNGGCVPCGTRRVRGTNPPGPNPGGKAMQGGGLCVPPAQRYAAADGTEEVAAWRCVDECPVRQLDAQAGERGGGYGVRGKGRRTYNAACDLSLDNATGQTVGYGDAGGPSRFFYCAKASRADRGAGNTHPTVKPHELMRWLVRLVTPPGGAVLDPFCGSGSTGLACLAEGLRFTGIEQSKEYVRIARRRLSAAASRPKLGNAINSSQSERRAA
jgi:DNA modification methylase